MFVESNSNSIRMGRLFRFLGEQMGNEQGQRKEECWHI